MQKCYEKSEIRFSLLWIVLYVVGGSLADRLSDAIGLAKSLSLVFYLILTVIALVWILRSGLKEKYGLCKPAFPARSYLYYLPLAVCASCNLWFGIAMNLSPLETAFYIASMICVGFLEEIIFRGFLFKAMSKDGLKSAIIVSSVTFGIGHIVNLVNGSGADVVSNLCQVGYAIAFGFLFVIIFHRGKSLVPCIAAHSVTNALSVFANDSMMTGTVQIAVSLVLTGIAVGYALILLLTLRSK